MADAELETTNDHVILTTKNTNEHENLTTKHTKQTKCLAAGAMMS